MSARDGCTVSVSWPCGQDSQPKPGCHQRRNPAPRGERRELLVLTAGPVQYYGRYPPLRWLRPDLTARGFWPSSFGVDAIEGREGLETMTRSTRDLPVRRRGELSRDRTIHRVSSAIDALRRLNAREADGTPTVGRSERSALRAPAAIARLGASADAVSRLCGRATHACTARIAKPIRSGIYAPTAAAGDSRRLWVKSCDTA